MRRSPGFGIALAVGLLLALSGAAMAQPAVLRSPAWPRRGPTPSAGR
jgi:hypothetical protein